MCGIAGIIDQSIGLNERKNYMQKMLELILHRGPDFSDSFHDEIVSLGHNRLSIIDLNPASNQPFIKDEYVIVFNGEIYNYKELQVELKTKGVVFRTDGDTEVLLEGYRIWGEDVLDNLHGMFSFVIYNKRNGNVFGARDRFGIKPFYFINKNSSFSFASEVKALTCLPNFSSAVNLNQAKLFLNLGWYYNEDQTLYDEVKTLCPGQKFTFNNGKLILKNYYSIEKIENSLSDDDSIEKFEELLLNSLRIHLRTDVPFGALLSGGIDSSVIVSQILEKKLTENLNTFSIYYEKDKFDEREFINEVVNKYSDKIQANYLSPNEDNVLNEFGKITHFQDFPISGSSAISQYFIMEAVAKKGVKVVLSGQGADDYLAGYMHSYYRLYSGYLKKFRLLKFYKEFKYQKKYQNLNSKQVLAVLSKSILSCLLSETGLYNLELNRYYPKIIEGSYKGLFEIDKAKEFGDLNGFLYALMTKSNLPNLLHLEDRNSMAFSIESRVPFLDHKLVEFGLNSKPELKINDGLTKYILRESNREVLPSKIYSRKDKKGFVTPGEVSWMKGSLSFLLDKPFTLPFEISNTKLDNVIKDFKSGNNKNASLVWRTCMLNYWCENK